MRSFIRPSICRLPFYAVSVLAFTGCVSSGQYKAVQAQAAKNDSLYTWSMRTLKTCQDNNEDLKRQKTALQDHNNDLDLQLTATKENVTMLRGQLKSLSAISNAQAESIKKSLDNMGAKDAYLMEIRSSMASRDSANMAMLMDLKGSIGGYGEQNLKIVVEKGVVNIELSDSLLYIDSNSDVLSSKARAVMGRLAKVLNAHPESNVIVEGSAGLRPVVAVDNAVKTEAIDTAVVRVDTAFVRVDSAVVLVDSVARVDTASNTRVSASIGSSGLSIDSATAAGFLRGAAMLGGSKDSLPPANWQLAVNRSAALVHLLDSDFHVSPLRMTASGKAAAAHTRIIIRSSTERLDRVLEHGPARKGEGSPAQPTAAVAVQTTP